MEHPHHGPWPLPASSDTADASSDAAYHQPLPQPHRRNSDLPQPHPIPHEAHQDDHLPIQSPLPIASPSLSDQPHPSDIADSHHTLPPSLSGPPADTAGRSNLNLGLDFDLAREQKPIIIQSLAIPSASHSSPVSPLELPQHRFDRSGSVDSPTLYEHPSALRDSHSSYQSDIVDREPHLAAGTRESRNIPEARDPDLPDSSSEDLSEVLSEYDNLISDLTRDSGHDTAPTAIDDASDDCSNYSGDGSCESEPTPMVAPKPTPPHLKLETVEASANQDEPLHTTRTATPQLDKPLPKSPGPKSPFAALFSWGNPSPSATEFSSIPSPSSPSRKFSGNETPPTTANTFLSVGTKPHVATENPLNYCESYLSTPPPTGNITPSPSTHLDEMEDELKAISSELAASIRREMDLEDLVDRLQDQVNNPQAPGKRTSDYFSDSGYSSAKQSDVDQSREEIEKIQRRSEQEKASVRLELTNKLQDERSRRKALDEQIKDLQDRTSQFDLARMDSMNANGRVKELENSCEDLRRRLSEERESKNNFEDLLTALKGELMGACNERDNLRDEVVPQLKARVEGLESEAAEYANLTYESSKMQQELQALKEQNISLKNGAGLDDLPMRSSRALSRSNSVLGGPLRGQKQPGSALSRSNSVKAGQGESREALAERLKDVEAQRDALHSALKNLLERQDFQNRENQKKIKVLEQERVRLLSDSPKKAGFEKEISNLRNEINVLRRRAEEAIGQKWEVEKGLGGLKMDLDRAEEEIETLRNLLKQKDILLPPSSARTSSIGSLGVPVTSDSLRKAYQDLQASYKGSLEKIKRLEDLTGPGQPTEKARLAMERLEQSLAAAISERDAAQNEANGLRGRCDGYMVNEAKNVESEKVLADELTESARQVEQLASQVQQQLAANAELRLRLSDTVARGDTERKGNYERIIGLQNRLHALEEQLVSTQTSSEDRVARHEEEISRLNQAHNEKLRRMETQHRSRKSSMLANKPAPLALRSPNSVSPKSVADEVDMKNLRTRIGELEKALADAEKEMQEVVAKMSTAQIEVMNLQEERDQAARETRKLQRYIEEEQKKSFEERFQALKGNVQ